jgi:transposase
MIKVDQLMEINDLHRQGHSIRDIARISGHSRNTVRKVLRAEHDPKFHTPQRSSKLDPYKDYIKQRYEQHRLSAVRLIDEARSMGYKRYEQHRLSAVRLIDEARSMGYTGSIATLRRYLRTLRGEQHRRSRLTVRFETPPGRQAQADWAYCGKFPDQDAKPVPVYLFLMVLSYSRRMFLRFTTSMKMPQLIECHQQAFAYFGGVPATVLYDNMKQVRIGAGKLNEQLVDFANHYGFTPKTHRAYRPRTKGKVERPVDYVKDNFLAGREFDGLDDLNARGLHWLDHTANVRIHGTTKQRPIDLFEQEKPTLTPIEQVPPYRFIDPVRRVVSYESMVQFHGSRYSVPPQYAGQKVEVTAEGGQILVRVGDTIIAEHRQAQRPGQCVVEKQHMAELWRLTQQQVHLPDEAPRWHVRFDQHVQTTPLATFEEVIA